MRVLREDRGHQQYKNLPTQYGNCCELLKLLRVSSNSLFCAALQLPQVWTQAASICPLYSLAVTAEDGRRYRNPHCAACNGRDLNTTFCDLGPGPRRRPASGVLARLMVPALTFLLQYTPGQVSSAHTAVMQEAVRCCLSGVRGRPVL